MNADTVQTEVADALADTERTFQRRRTRATGRRSTDIPIVGWSTVQLAYWIGMSKDFVIGEIQAREIKATMFGVEYRIHATEVKRYLLAKGWPLPSWMPQSDDTADTVVTTVTETCPLST